MADELADTQNDENEFRMRGDRGIIGARSLPEHQATPDRPALPDHMNEPAHRAQLRPMPGYMASELSPNAEHYKRGAPPSEHGRMPEDLDGRIEELLDRGYGEVDFGSGHLVDTKIISDSRPPYKPRLFVLVEGADE